MEHRITMPLADFERMKEMANKKLTFHDITVICPYCKHPNKYNQMDVGIGTGHRFIYCDCEDGGCDRQFILKTSVVSTFGHDSFKIPE